MHGIPRPGRGSRRPQRLAARGYPMVEVSPHVTADPVSEPAGPLSETTMSTPPSPAPPVPQANSETTAAGLRSMA
jgi:hypothetical protein